MALKGLGMGEEKHSKGKLRAPVIMAVIAVMISLFPLLVACSSQGSKDQSDVSRRPDEGQRGGATRGGQTGNARTEDASGGKKGARRSETQAALVPIAHLSSTVENVSMEELSGTRGLAVGRGYRDEAEGLIGSARFERRRGRPREQDSRCARARTLERGRSQDQGSVRRQCAAPLCRPQRRLSP